MLLRRTDDDDLVRLLDVLLPLRCVCSVVADPCLALPVRVVPPRKLEDEILVPLSDRWTIVVGHDEPASVVVQQVP